jgi:hypothetical protein
MWESWRTYISFVLVGAIFILCQALSGGMSSRQSEDATADPGDRSYREALRDETSGRGGPTLPSLNRASMSASRFAGAGSERPQTD